jgi:hypothetical protein
MLLQLDKNIEVSKGEMAASGIVRECADCAVNGEGTCCSARTGQKSDSILLLVNLLLNNPLPEKEYNADLCYFLTGSGCSLRARPVICVNFVCSRIRENIPFQALIHLQQTIGIELDTLFMIEEYVKRKIAGKKDNAQR